MGSRSIVWHRWLCNISGFVTRLAVLLISFTLFITAAYYYCVLSSNIRRRFTGELLLGWWSNEFCSCFIFRVNFANLSNRMLCVTRGEMWNISNLIIIVGNCYSCYIDSFVLFSICLGRKKSNSTLSIVKSRWLCKRIRSYTRARRWKWYSHDQNHTGYRFDCFPNFTNDRMLGTCIRAQRNASKFSNYFMWFFCRRIFFLIKFMNFQGLLAAIPLAYILPALAYIKMSPQSTFSREKLPALGLVGFGTIVTLAGSALLLPSLTGDCKSDIVLDYCKNYGS